MPNPILEKYGITTLDKPLPIPTQTVSPAKQNLFFNIVKDALKNTMDVIPFAREARKAPELIGIPQRLLWGTGLAIGPIEATKEERRKLFVQGYRAQTGTEFLQLAGIDTTKHPIAWGIAGTALDIFSDPVLLAINLSPAAKTYLGRKISIEFVNKTGNVLTPTQLGRVVSEISRKAPTKRVGSLIKHFNRLRRMRALPKPGQRFIPTELRPAPWGIRGEARVPEIPKVPKGITPKARPPVPLVPKVPIPPPAPPIRLPEGIPEAIEPEGIPPTQKVISALKEAKSVRKVQETLYRKERAIRLAKAQAVGKKVTGERGFYAELAQLRGKLPRVQFETIRGKVGQTDIDSLFNQIKESPVLSEWSKITTRSGLSKLFGEQGGVVPTEGELKLLKRVFGEEFTKAILAKRGLLAKLKNAGYQLWNIPKSMMASLDFSAPFRQGAFLIGRPKQFWPAFGKMFKPFVSEKAFQAIQEDIIRRPTAPLMDEAGLSLTGLDATLSTREEAFMSSWAEKIPIAGPIVRASGRAYIAFLNKLRADVFDDLVSKAEKLGLDPKRNLDLTKAIAGFVNTATGRGSLAGLEKAAVGLNSMFFSPRLIASRLSLLNPIYYINQPPFVRKEALKSLFSFAGIAMTILGLAGMAGLEVGRDPRSSDFGKIKIGNTRIDLLGGFQPYIRMAAQLITGEYVSSTTGKEYTLGEGYKPLTRYGILLRQIEGKFNPSVSFVIGLLKGRTYTGESISVPKELGMRFVPMTVQDLYDIMKDNPTLWPLTGLAVFGVGVQTYALRGKKVTTRNPILEKYGITEAAKQRNPILEKYGIK